MSLMAPSKLNKAGAEKNIESIPATTYTIPKMKQGFIRKRCASRQTALLFRHSFFIIISLYQCFLCGGKNL